MARSGEAQFHFAGHVLVLPYQILHVAESGTLQGLGWVWGELAQHFSQIGGAHHRGRAVIGLCDPASERSRREILLALIQLGIETAQRGYGGCRDYQVGRIRMTSDLDGSVSLAVARSRTSRRAWVTRIFPQSLWRIAEEHPSGRAF